MLEFTLLAQRHVYLGVSGIDFARHVKRNPNTRQIPLIILRAPSGEAENYKS